MEYRRNAKQYTEQNEHAEQFVGTQHVKTISGQFQIKNVKLLWAKKKRTNTEQQKEEQQTNKRSK